jgi:hypothetical protein
MTVDEQFEEIREDMLRKAAAVDCSIPEYIEQLKDVIENIETAIEAAQGDLHRQEEEAMAAGDDEE